MTFWDTSALLLVLAEQPGGLDVVPLMEKGSDVAVWWGTRVELVSGVCRLHREGRIDEKALSGLLSKIDAVTSEANQVEPTEQVERLQFVCLELHNLRAADALQLAAALYGQGIIQMAHDLCL